MADHQQAQSARLDPRQQPAARLDDDLGPDAGRIAHGDCQSRHPVAHRVSPSSPARNPVSPNAPDLDTRRWPSQLPPRISDVGTPGSSSPSTSSRVTPSASHTSRSVSPPVTNRVPGRWTRSQQRRKTSRRCAGVPRAGRSPAGRSHITTAVRNSGGTAATCARLTGMVAADQRQERQRQSGPRHKTVAGERTGKAAGAAPQHASVQPAALGHDGIQVGVGLGIAHMRHDAMRAQFGRQIDAGVAPAIAVARKLSAVASDSALERERRRQHAMIEPAHAGGEFQRHMAAQQAVDLLERRIAAVQQRRETLDAGALPFRQAGRGCRCRSRADPSAATSLPGDGNRTGQRHEPGRAVQRAGQVVGQQTQACHDVIIAARGRLIIRGRLTAGSLSLSDTRSPWRADRALAFPWGEPPRPAHPTVAAVECAHAAVPRHRSWQVDRSLGNCPRLLGRASRRPLVSALLHLQLHSSRRTQDRLRLCPLFGTRRSHRKDQIATCRLALAIHLFVRVRRAAERVGDATGGTPA